MLVVRFASFSQDGLNHFGKNWKQIAEHIATRTSAQVRSHAQKYFSKVQAKEREDAGASPAAGGVGGTGVGAGADVRL